MSQCSKYSSSAIFLLFNGFSWMRALRLRREFRQKRIRVRNLIKEEPKHLRHYIMPSGIIRCL